MKVSLFARASFFIGVFTLIVGSLFSRLLFAESSSLDSSATVLVQINKKLDLSQKRKDQMLANQDETLSELIKSRKIAFNNRKRASRA